MYWEIRDIIRKKCYYHVQLHSSTQPYNSLSQKKTLTPISIPKTLKNNLPSKIFLISRTRAKPRTWTCEQQSSQRKISFFSFLENRIVRREATWKRRVQNFRPRYCNAVISILPVDTKLGTKYNFIFEIGTGDSLLHATRGFYRRRRHAPRLFLPSSRRKVPFLVNLTRGESLRSCERNCL